MKNSDGRETIEPASREEWREWLKRNHQTSRGVWLIYKKKTSAGPGPRYEEVVEEAVAFGWIDSRVNSLDAERVKQLFTPRKPGSAWSPSNKRRVELLLARGLMAPAGMRAVDAARANGSWTALDDVENLVVPSDLSKALVADGKAQRHFDAFSDSAKKMILFWIQSAKRPETRAKRIEETVRAAAENRRPGQ
ncbi:MAG: hypothetical protein C4521_01375 [Actinobacteria bacterium]|nr:MAG: hypothetical protein C4521_01375 [Actinomycetota bacterium]